MGQQNVSHTKVIFSILLSLFSEWRKYCLSGW